MIRSRGSAEFSSCPAGMKTRGTAAALVQYRRKEEIKSAIKLVLSNL